MAQAAAVGLVEATGNVTNTEIKNCSFRSNVDAANFIDFGGAACSGVISNCMFSSLDIAGAMTTIDFTGGHVFECYVSGEADKYGIVGGGTIYS